MKKNIKRKGFTLIELIVVIAILGILAAIAVPRFAGTLNTSKLKTHNANVRTIESAVGVYQAEHNGTFPANIDALVPDYLQAVPTNPITSGTGSGTYAVDGTTGAVTPAIVSVP